MSTDNDPVAESLARAKAMYARDLTCQTLGIALDDVSPGHGRAEKAGSRWSGAEKRKAPPLLPR